VGSLRASLSLLGPGLDLIITGGVQKDGVLHGGGIVVLKALEDARKKIRQKKQEKERNPARGGYLRPVVAHRIGKNASCPVEGSSRDGVLQFGEILQALPAVFVPEEEAVCTGEEARKMVNA